MRLNHFHRDHLNAQYVARHPGTGRLPMLYHLRSWATGEVLTSDGYRPGEGHLPLDTLTADLPDELGEDWVAQDWEVVS